MKRILTYTVALLPLAFVVGCGGGGSGGGGDTLSGVINVASFSLPAGQTRTVNADLTIKSTGAIDIAGSLLVKPGVNVALVSTGKFTLTGAIKPAPGKAVAKPARAVGHAGVTRDEPADVAILISGRDVEINSSLSSLEQGGITAPRGTDVYIANTGASGLVTISKGDITTEDGPDGRDQTLDDDATSGYTGGNIHIGDDEAKSYIKTATGSPGYSPTVLVFAAKAKAGNGGKGGAATRFEATFSQLHEFQNNPGYGGRGGTITFEAGRVNATGATITAGDGGRGPDFGSADKPITAPKPNTEPGVTPQPFVIVTSEGGRGGSVLVSGQTIGTPGKGGDGGDTYVTLPNGGDGAAATADHGVLAPGNGPMVYAGSLGTASSGEPSSVVRPSPALSHVTISGGKGGDSMAVGNAGGKGAAVTFLGKDQIPTFASVKITKFGMGGKGFNGCNQSPVAKGSAGGDPGQALDIEGHGGKPLVPLSIKGATSRVNGNLVPLVPDTDLDSFTGGSGGDGSPPGKGGGLGADNNGNFLGRPSSDGKECSATCQTGRSTLYTLYDLGSLSAFGDESEAYAISPGGLVVGRSGAVGRNHGFVWDLNHGMVDVGTLPGLSNSSARGVNDSGLIVGDCDEGSTRHAFLFNYSTLTGTITSRTDLHQAGFTESHAVGVNRSGQIGGYAYFANTSTDAHAIVWQNGSITDLSASGLQQHLFGNTLTQAINVQGRLVGYTGNRGFRSGPVSSIQVSDFLPTLTPNSGDLYGYSGVSAAYGINDAGTAVGYSTDGGQTFQHAVRFDSIGIHDLDNRGANTASTALAINNLDQTVGWANISGNQRAVIWDGTVMTDLTTLLASPSSMQLLSATGINDCGWIIGIGYTSNQSRHAFVMVPSGSRAVPAGGLRAPAGVKR